jgi:hypothetical protein
VTHLDGGLRLLELQQDVGKFQQQSAVLFLEQGIAGAFGLEVRVGFLEQIDGAGHRFVVSRLRSRFGDQQQGGSGHPPIELVGQALVALQERLQRIERRLALLELHLTDAQANGRFQRQGVSRRHLGKELEAIARVAEATGFLEQHRRVVNRPQHVVGRQFLDEIVHAYLQQRILGQHVRLLEEILGLLLFTGEIVEHSFVMEDRFRAFAVEMIEPGQQVARVVAETRIGERRQHAQGFFRGSVILGHEGGETVVIAAKRMVAAQAILATGQEERAGLEGCRVVDQAQLHLGHVAGRLRCQLRVSRQFLHVVGPFPGPGLEIAKDRREKVQGFAELQPGFRVVFAGIFRVRGRQARGVVRQATRGRAGVIAHFEWINYLGIGGHGGKQGQRFGVVFVVAVDQAHCQPETRRRCAAGLGVLGEDFAELLGGDGKVFLGQRVLGAAQQFFRFGIGGTAGSGLRNPPPGGAEN